MYKRVRIYEGKNGESTIVGFSASGKHVPEAVEFKKFIHEKGYSVEPVIEDYPEEIPYQDIEIRPPMKDVDVLEFGNLCLRLIDEYHNGILVLDHRHEEPKDYLFGGNVIAFKS